MGFIQRWRDSVKDTTTSTGTGNLVLAENPSSGCQSFADAYGTADNVPVSITIRHATNGEWESCLAVYNHSTLSLVRGELLSSSTGARIDFASGEKAVAVTIPSAALGAIRWRSVDLRDYITKRETDLSQAMTDTSLPASPQVTETIVAGDMIAMENIEQFCAIFAVALENVGGGGLNSVYMCQATLNGANAGSSFSVTCQPDTYGVAGVNFSMSANVGDVVGLKIYRSSGTGTCTIKRKHLLLFPFKIITLENDALLHAIRSEIYATNNSGATATISGFSLRIKGANFYEVTIALATQPATYIHAGTYLQTTGSTPQAFTKNNLSTLDYALVINALPTQIAILTVNDL